MVNNDLTMNKKDCTILFMGTAAFAVPSLQALVEGGYKIGAVVTMPDKPMGRGHKLQAGPVKQYAAQQGLEILQPEKLTDEKFLNRLKEIDADLGIVVAFRMLPKEVWSMPPMGTINLHGSLLPRYRGAAPINWAVINGDKETGATTFRLRHEIDTGEILLQEKMSIGDDETAGEVHDRMMTIGAGLLLRTVDGLLAGSITGLPQEEINEKPTLAPKIFKETGIIDWSESAEKIHNLIRGLAPSPGARSELSIDGMPPVELKILASEEIDFEHRHTGVSVGHAISYQNSIEVVCGRNVLRLKTIQPPGKKAMKSADFLNGLRSR